MREQAGRHLAKIVYKLDLRGERNISFGFDMHSERCVQVVPPSPNIGTLRPTGGRDPVRMGGVDISRYALSGPGQFMPLACLGSRLSIKVCFNLICEAAPTYLYAYPLPTSKTGDAYGHIHVINGNVNLCRLLLSV